MEKSGDSGKETYRDRRSCGNCRTNGAVRQPVERLCERGDADGYKHIAEQPRTKPERSLLQSRIDAGCERNVGNLNQHNRQAPVRAGAP